nr:PREDICTED: myb/SANT-like DNA-binding domain-containing protein 3 [Tribolium castaneum]|eukprot:XP_015836542.1 PREDICTED: myb/SANT-like DNA-binding domain-containing protein 3 [Tribolium castaneum]
MTEAKVHRERTKNFTEREKEIALDIINRYQNKIENKETDGVSQKERKDAWEKVAEEFNSASSTAPRTGKQMKVLWSNLRRTAKKNIAEENI